MKERYSHDDQLADFRDPGMHATWLVQDPLAFQVNLQPTSERDRLLHFGVTYREWYALYFDVLRAGEAKYEGPATKQADESQSGSLVIEFESEIPGYPMLSRIRGYLYDAIFHIEDVDQLRQECLRVRELTENRMALGAIQKLIVTSDCAKTLKVGIYLLCQ